MKKVGIIASIILFTFFTVVSGKTKDRRIKNYIRIKESASPKEKIDIYNRKAAAFAQKKLAVNSRCYNFVMKHWKKKRNGVPLSGKSTIRFKISGTGSDSAWKNVSRLSAKNCWGRQAQRPGALTLFK